MKLWKMSRTEIKRLFSVTNIISTLCFSLLIIIICVVTFIKQYDSIIDINFYYMFTQILYGGYFIELLFIPFGYFVTTNVCTDVTEKVFRLFIARTGTYSYIIAKYLIGVIYSFIMAMLVFNIFAAVGISILPAADKNFYSGGADVYEDLLRSHCFLYFEMRIIFVSLVTAFFTAVGMLLSTVIHKLYVSALSPYLSYTIITRLQLIFGMPEQVQFSSIYSGFLRTQTSIGWSISYIILFHMICLLFMGIAYTYVMKRRCCGEKD